MLGPQNTGAELRIPQDEESGRARADGSCRNRPHTPAPHAVFPVLSRTSSPKTWEVSTTDHPHEFKAKAEEDGKKRRGLGDGPKCLREV